MLKFVSLQKKLRNPPTGITTVPCCTPGFGLALILAFNFEKKFAISSFKNIRVAVTLRAMNRASNCFTNWFSGTGS